MKKYLTLFGLLFSMALNAQSTSDFQNVSLQDKENSAVEGVFYIEHVYDGRQFKDNIGTVQKGAFNRKTFARFEKPFEQELSDYLSVTYPKTDKKKAISVRISELYISELTRALSETGYASIVLDVIENHDGKEFIVGRYASSQESNGMDVTRKHDERLKLCLKECLKQYAFTFGKDKENVSFDPQAAISKTLPEKIKKGIYLNYSDLLNNTPQDTLDFSFSSTNGKYQLLRQSTGKLLPNHYAFSNGYVVFLNVSKYAKDKYYAETEIINNKFFIDNIIYNENTSIMWGAMFGLVGVLIASDDDNSGSSPMLIDGYSGKPQSLTHSQMKKTLEPYPELLKEYKKGKQTLSHKKAIIRRIP